MAVSSNRHSYNTLMVAPGQSFRVPAQVRNRTFSLGLRQSRILTYGPSVASKTQTAYGIHSRNTGMAQHGRWLTLWMQESMAISSTPSAQLLPTTSTQSVSKPALDSQIRLLSSTGTDTLGAS